MDPLELPKETLRNMAIIIDCSTCFILNIMTVCQLQGYTAPNNKIIEHWKKTVPFEVTRTISAFECTLLWTCKGILLYLNGVTRCFCSGIVLRAKSVCMSQPTYSRLSDRLLDSPALIFVSTCPLGGPTNEVTPSFPYTVLRFAVTKDRLNEVAFAVNVY